VLPGFLRPHPDTLAANAAGLDRALGLVLLASLGLLLAGISLPIMTVRSLLIFGEDISLLEGLQQLLDQGEYLLFAILALFSIVFPLAKMALAWAVWRFARRHGKRLHSLLARIELLGRWSMLDVFVVALVIVAFKLSLITNVTVHAGIYLFAGAIVLSMLAVNRIVRLAARAAAG
jgi:paraquat-inducible protein A